MASNLDSASAEALDLGGHSPPVTVGAQIANLAGVTLPFVGLIAACVLAWGQGFSWVELSLLAGMYLLTAVGITVGFHRLFTHRSFETTGFVQLALAVLGSMAAQGPLLKWVAHHRRHHQFSDRAGDPHSPYHSGTGVLGVLRGWWHSHLGWIFLPEPPDLFRYVKDLQQSATLRWVSNLFPLWVAIGLVVPAILGYLMVGDWTGAMLGLIWGGLVRLFLVHHVTWSINSVCHIWGARPYPAQDHSRNNVIFGVLAMGEGWHNNHHAFPTSARHGFHWWQIDMSWWFIQVLAWFGWAWKVKLPHLSSDGGEAPAEADLLAVPTETPVAGST